MFTPLKKLRLEHWVFIVLIPALVLICWLDLIAQDKAANDLKENGVQLNATITKTYVAVFDQGAIQYTCSIEHNGVEKTLTAFGGAYTII